MSHALLGQGDSDDHGKPWTVSRCNRLLRPLASKLAALRRQQHPIARNNLSRHHAHGLDSGFAPGISKTLEDTSSTNTDEEEDCHWDSFGRKRRPQKTYSARGSTKSHNHSSSAIQRSASLDENSSDPQHLSLPTPFLNRVRPRPCSFDAAPSVDATSATADDTADSNVPLSRKRRRNNDPPTFCSPTSALGAFRSLLMATPDRAVPPRGPSSLMAMCLRRIPANIEDEVRWRKAVDKDDKSDVSAETFALIEEFGQMQSSRWDGLRDVCRAYGIRLVQDAIEDGVFDDKMVEALASWCKWNGASDAKDKIVVAYTRRHASRKHHIETRAGPWSRHSPWTFTLEHDLEIALPDHEAGQRTGLFNTLNMCLAEDHRLPLTSMAAEFGKLSRLIVRSVANNDYNHGDTLAATEDMLVTLVGIDLSAHAGGVVGFGGGSTSHKLFLDLEHTALQQNREPLMTTKESSPSLHMSAANLIAMLTSMSVMSRDIDPEDTSELDRALRPVRGAALQLMQALALTSCPLPFSEEQAMLATTLLTADTIVLINNGAPSTSTASPATLIAQRIAFMLRLRSSFSSPLAATDHASRIATAVATCVERAHVGHGFALLQRLAEHLRAFSPADDPTAAAFTDHVALAACLGFAQTTGQAKHLVYASVVEQAICHGATPRRHSHSHNPTDTPRDAFRWEEGLCEWVAATPWSLRKPKQWGRPPQTLACQDAASPSRTRTAAAIAEDFDELGGEEPEMPAASLALRPPLTPSANGVNIIKGSYRRPGTLAAKGSGELNVQGEDHDLDELAM